MVSKVTKNITVVSNLEKKCDQINNNIPGWLIFILQSMLDLPVI